MISSMLSSVRESYSEFFNSRLPAGVTIRLKICSILFAPQRADYYSYLADMVEATKGSINFKTLFSNDAKRYKGTLRGTMTSHWAKQIVDNGGKLHGALAGTIPNDDVQVIKALQETGGHRSIEDGFKDLAQNSLIAAKARSILLVTSFASLVCVALIFALIFIMPTVVVPIIKSSFSMLPPEFYPPSAVSLFEFADFVASYWLLICLLVTFFIGICYYSLSNLTGPVRIFLDKYGVVWGLARDFQAMRFLTSLSAMTKKRGNVSKGLKESIQLQVEGSSRWKKHHVNRMLAMIEGGNASSDIFATGLMDRATYFYLDDLIESRGFDDALQYVRSRVEERVLKRITLQSAILSWFLILTCLGVGGYLSFWPTAVLDDMRKALQQYLS